jgi:hypothetical protein
VTTLTLPHPVTDTVREGEGSIVKAREVPGGDDERRPAHPHRRRAKDQHDATPMDSPGRSPSSGGIAQRERRSYSEWRLEVMNYWPVWAQKV